MAAFVIDAFEFCRLGEQAEGEFPVAKLERLAGETADGVGVLRWNLAGDVGKHGHAQLSLSISGQVNLVCQRCLAAMPFDVASESRLVLAENEEAADAIEELLSDESIDVIVGDPAFDIAHLVEDEALLALPVAPKHDFCPAKAGVESGVEKKDSPFSVLKNLKL